MHISRTKDSAQVLPDARNIISRARTGKDFNGAYSSNGIIHYFYIRLADEWLTQLARPSRTWRRVVLLPRPNVAIFTGVRSSSWATTAVGCPYAPSASQRSRRRPAICGGVHRRAF